MSVSLSQDDVEAVEKFVLFVGYPQSRYRDIGRLIRAHPDINIAREFHVLQRWPQEANLHDKTYLFNQLFQNSLRVGAKVERQSLQQDKSTKLKVIGDDTITDWYQKSVSLLRVYYNGLRSVTKVPIRVMHIVRNPYDMIASSMVYRRTGRSDTASHGATLMECVNDFIEEAAILEEIIAKLGLVVFEVHIEELVKDPKGILLRICEFLEVKCSQKYLQTFGRTAKSTFRTRESIAWNEEAMSAIKKSIEAFSAFRGYTFEDEFWNPLVVRYYTKSL